MKLTKLYQYLQYKENNLLLLLHKELQKLDYTIYTGDSMKYIYARPKGNEIPVMLVAHVDTVHYNIPLEIFYDDKKKVMWSPDGLGADDRAGVFAIMELVKKYNVAVLFTTGEESGGKGARAFITDYKNNQGFKMLIQLDRRGTNDCVFYSNDAKDFQDYIVGAGFVKKSGSFSDISIIAPEWEVNSVNVSVGYYDEHTKAEHLYVEDLFDTINKIALLLNQEIPEFEYKEYCFMGYNNYNRAGYGSFNSYDGKYYDLTTRTYKEIDRTKDKDFIDRRSEFLVDCCICANIVDERDAVYTAWEDADTFICEDCFGSFDGFYCGECFDPVFPDELDNTQAIELQICDACFAENFLDQKLPK